MAQANMNIQRNARVIASDGEVGKVTHVVVDPNTREVTHIVVENEGEEHAIPVSHVATVAGDRVTLRGGAAEVSGVSRFDREDFRPVDDDEARAETTRTAARGGAPLVDADEDAVQVGGERTATTERMVTTERTATKAAVETEHPERRDADLPYHLHLREERLNVFKEREHAGSVRLGTRVVEREETVTVPLREERVVIERRAGSGEVVRDDIDAGSDKTISVEVMRERARVEKDAVVSEEVEVHTEATQHDERVSETLRREELVVEGDTRLVTDQGGERMRAGGAAGDAGVIEDAARGAGGAARRAGEKITGRG